LIEGKHIHPNSGVSVFFIPFHAPQLFKFFSEFLLGFGHFSAFSFSTLSFSACFAC
jgi:hypothetical protein